MLAWTSELSISKHYPQLISFPLMIMLINSANQLDCLRVPAGRVEEAAANTQRNHRLSIVLI